MMRRTSPRGVQTKTTQRYAHLSQDTLIDAASMKARDDGLPRFARNDERERV
jgi:hypothetical protein